MVNDNYFADWDKNRGATNRTQLNTQSEPKW
jgi:hypothetical protein